MSSITVPRPVPAEPTDEASDLATLEPGDCLDRPTFHARYEAMQTDQKFELIGGVVYMASPAKRKHGRTWTPLIHWLAEYELATVGTEVLVNTSTILTEEDEPQPDACLRILPEKGGQTRDEADWVIGGAEFVAEVASSTEAYDLHQKKAAYEKAGVREYLVIALKQKQVFWFIARQGKFVELPAGPDGILRSDTFPGLWLDPAALMEQNRQRLLDVLRQGLASPEHTAFVAKLAGQPGA